MSYAHATWLAQANAGRRLKAGLPLRAPRAYDGRTWDDLGEHVEEHREDAAGDRTNGQKGGPA